MPTNVELSVQCNSLEDKFKQLMQKMLTKEDLQHLATKKDLSELVTKNDLNAFEEKFTKKIDSDLNTRFTTLNEEQKKVTDKIAEDVSAINQKVEKKLSEISAKRLLDEKFNFRYDFLLVGEPEYEGPWKETPKDCLTIVKTYLDIMLPSSETVSIVDCHRYGKKSKGVHSVTGKKLCRPIIFKVGSYFDVRTIWDNMSTLKEYFKENPTKRKVYFRRHIPKAMYVQRQSLQPKFTELYDAGTEPQWKLDTKTAKYYIMNSNGTEFRD